MLNLASQAAAVPAKGTSSCRQPSGGRTMVITVLAGGPSSEREVSLVSGKAVADALASLGHRVTMRDIRPEDLSALDAPADVIFPVLHGGFGEDGRLQGILEQRRLRYVGCGPEASALAMDKVRTKQACAAKGIPTADWIVATAANRDAAMRTWTGRKVAVKPVDQGSSVDTYIVPDTIDLAQAVDRLITRYGQAMVEQYIDGPELTVGVLAGQPLPVIEIVPKATFYDYHAKYVAEDTNYIVNPPLPATLLKQVQDLSARVFAIIGCRDLSRVDWRIDKATEQPYLLEINTLPGFTSHSLLPKAAAAVGIDFAHLCDKLARMAMDR